jgi:2-polyprenyl-3-methyl-5-hydroxy-6-metoxy-1,4-benzoquinol methylase
VAAQPHRTTSQDHRSPLTDQSYWEEIWQSAENAKLFDPADRSVRNHGNVALHDFFSAILRTASPRAKSLVEIGCAQSKWLPYFAQVHNLTVAGLDYSEIGCARARALLRRAECRGEIFQSDIFNPPAELRSRFDVVLSMGLVEHFADTVGAVSACAALANPGGIVVTTIPNLTGAIGLVQRRLDRAVYDKHVPLDCAALRTAHEKCGLTILRSEYLSSANFAVLNLPNLKPKIFERTVRGLALAATAGIWALEAQGVRVAPTQFLSPYIACVAKKTGEASPA